MPENVNLHLCGTSKGGVSVGKANTEDYESDTYVPKFECEYPAYFYEEVEQDFDNHAPSDASELMSYTIEKRKVGRPFDYAIECSPSGVPGGNLYYKTSELNTGKKWIDGKDIYMQVCSYTAFSSSGHNVKDLGLNIDVTSIDTVVKIEGYLRTDNVVQTSVYTPGSVSNNVARLRHYPNNKVLQIERSAGSTVKGGGGIIWYTKK